MGFRTTVIISATSLLLGSTFTHWIVDHNTLWRSPVTEPALLTSLSYYSSYVSAPPVVFGVWIATVGIAVGALAWKTVKGWREGTGAFLFDSAGLFLFLAVAWIHLTDINPNYKLIHQSLPDPLPSNYLAGKPVLVKALRDLAASHAVSAVALTGVMLMQSARYYAAHLDSTDTPDESLLSAVSPLVQPTIPTTASGLDEDVPPSPLTATSDAISSAIEIEESESTTAATSSPTRRKSSRESRARRGKSSSSTGK